MPVPILTNRKSSTDLARPACCSPSAMMFTSLSTSTGQPSSLASVSRTGKWFQPGMIGGDTGTPSRKLTGPGTPGAGADEAGGRRRRPAACRPAPGVPGGARPPGPAGCRPARLRWDSDPQLPVGDRDVDRGGADVDPEEAGVPGRSARSTTAGRRGRRPARPSRPGRAGQPVQLRPRAWSGTAPTASPSSARERGPSSRRSRSRRACCAFSGRTTAIRRISASASATAYAG